MVMFENAVYILENPKAQRVKVGVTCNDVALRLSHFNDIWLGRKVTCQICGGFYIKIGRVVKPHYVSGRLCQGGGKLPLEEDAAHAESYLENMKNSLGELSGSEKTSITRKAKNLEKRIEQYKHYDRPGEWQFSAAYYTTYAGKVESLSHEILADRLDNQAPFGEVFCCSVSEATEAVETALSQLELLDSARKETQLPAERTP
jgi:hypothetical protein